MSEYKVPMTRIKEILPHPNATALEYAVVYGFKVIVRKNEYHVDTPVIYVPIDSLLPNKLEQLLFKPDSKIKLNKGRVKQIKIRGEYSQGMIIDIPTIMEYLNHKDGMKLDIETDYAEMLGIIKYEPPAAAYQGANTGGNKRDKPKENPFFHVYGGIDNFKWYPELFAEGEEVSITEKIHGSNIRFGMVPYVANNPWRKLLRWLKLTPEFEWVYGSNRVQLQQRRKYKGWYGENVYGQVLEKYNAKDKVKPGEIWYGELYGDGIQKNYSYGCKPGEHRLVVFDMKMQDGKEDSKYLDAEYFFNLAQARGFETCPELYRGPFNSTVAKLMTVGNSVLEPSQKVREGVVVKSLKETTSVIGRKVLKLISEKYLEADNTDFH
jgi:RNA ligase (TIGR02306 family)